MRTSFEKTPRGRWPAVLMVAVVTLAGCTWYRLQDVNNNQTDGDVPDTCGNGTVDPGEFCDGEDLGGATCADYGFQDPDGLTCTTGCHLNPSGCTSVCGNGVVEPSELCDDGNGQLDDDCPDGPQGACVPAACGDGFRQVGVEECEGQDLAGRTCADLGYLNPAGLACASDCTFDESGCTAVCGNLVREPGEECDGSDLGGLDCQSLGYVNSVGLTCDNCQLDASGCTSVCGNGTVEPDEECEDGNTADWDGCSGCLISEFMINTTTGSDQMVANVAVAPDGSFVVVWSSNGQDGNKWGSYGQRYDAGGQKQGGEFQANTETNDHQARAVVAMAPGGAFVVVWHSNLQDGDKFGIFGQLYDDQGAPVGAEFQVNTYTPNDQRFPSVGMADDGAFVVAWQSKDQDGDGWGIYGRRYDHVGAPLGGEFQVNTCTSGDQQAPGIAVAADRSFVVVWESSAQDGDGFGIFGQRYDSQGVVAGSEFRINNDTLGDQQHGDVGFASDLSFVTAFQDDTLDGGTLGVFARRYDPQGAPYANAFGVNTYSTDDQTSPSVGVAGTGSFVVVWESHNQVANWDVFGQRYDSSGVAQGAEFQVSVYTAAEQQRPAVGVAADGSFVVVWESHNQVAGWDIFGQRYDPQGVPKGLIP